MIHAQFSHYKEAHYEAETLQLSILEANPSVDLVTKPSDLGIVTLTSAACLKIS